MIFHIIWWPNKIGFDCMTQWKHASVPNDFQARVILFACFFGDHPFVLWSSRLCRLCFFLPNGTSFTCVAHNHTLLLKVIALVVVVLLLLVLAVVVLWVLLTRSYFVIHTKKMQGEDRPFFLWDVLVTWVNLQEFSSE